MSSVDLTHLQGWIGREESANDLVTPELVRRFNATFNEGSAEPRRGDVAPRLIHFCLTPPVANASELGPDGHPARGGFLPPVPLPRRMWAGGSLNFPGDIRVGDEVTRRSRIADVQLKSGRQGELCFVTVEHRIEASGRVAVEEQQTLVYRGDSSESAPAAPAHTEDSGGAAPNAVIDADPTLLFRYSALTFNGHRIHYDRTYAVEVEGYPGLVVHGPLQATLLLKLATRLRGEPPAKFSFRGLSPLYDTAPVQIFAESLSGGDLRLWTARPNGPRATVADAHWTQGETVA